MPKSKAVCSPLGDRAAPGKRSRNHAAWRREDSDDEGDCRVHQHEVDYMSLPTTLNALIVVALVFIPGIIFGQLIRRSIAHFPETVDARHFLAMGASGLFLHTLVFPLGTRSIWAWYRDGTLDEHVLATYVWFLLVVFVWPVAAGVIAAWLIPKAPVKWGSQQSGDGIRR